MHGAPQFDQQGQYYPQPVAPYSTGPYRTGPNGAGRLPGQRRGMTWSLIAVGVVVAIVLGAVAGYTLTRGHGQPSRDSAAGGTQTSATPSGTGASTGPSTGPSAGPPVVGADGTVAAPARIGSLHFNPVLTTHYITNKLKEQLATDFGSLPSGVVGGFYTSDPAAKTTNRNYQLLFDVAYLAGAGHPNVAIRSFLNNRTLQSPVEIPAGSMGGKAGCSWLQVKSGRIAHCMWVDTNTYADFYAWQSSPAALAKTMLAARPQIELSGGLRGVVPPGMRAGGLRGVVPPGMRARGGSPAA
jgi:hypothetical protein